MQPLADGNLVLGLVNANLIYIVNVTDGTLVKTLMGGPTSFVANGLELIDNVTLISSSITSFVITWNLNTAGFTRYFDMWKSTLVPTTYTIKYLSNNMIAVGGSSSAIYIWNINTGTVITKLNGHISAVFALELISATTMASGSGSVDTRIIIWDILKMRLLYVLGSHLAIVRCLKLIGVNTLASSSDDLTVKIWDTSLRVLLRTLNGHVAPVYFLDSLDANLLISGSKDGIVNVWSSSTGVLLKKINDGSTLLSMKKLNILSRKFTHLNTAYKCRSLVKK